MDPTNPGRVVVTFGSYINKDSKEANGCVPTGFSQYGINTLHRGEGRRCVQQRHPDQRTSSDGGKTFTGTTQDPRVEPTVNPDAAAGDDRPVLAMGGVHTTGPARRHATTTGSTATTRPSADSDVSISGSKRPRRRSACDRVTSSSMPPPTQFGGQFYGDYTGLAASQKAFPIWMDTRDPELFLCPGTGKPGVPPRRLHRQLRVRRQRREGERPEHLHRSGGHSQPVTDPAPRVQVPSPQGAGPALSLRPASGLGPVGLGPLDIKLVWAALALVGPAHADSEETSGESSRCSTPEEDSPPHTMTVEDARPFGGRQSHPTRRPWRQGSGRVTSRAHGVTPTSSVPDARVVGLRRSPAPLLRLSRGRRPTRPPARRAGGSGDRRARKSWAREDVARRRGNTLPSPCAMTAPIR